MQFQMLARAAIVPSPLNPRKHVDPVTIDELAATMGNGVGIIEPLVVRPTGKAGTFELVVGERRWRAAEKAGLAEVPVIVKELTDAQVLEIMVIENNQREGVTPLEEARGYRQLMGLDKKAYSVPTIAEKIGRSQKYVWDRMKLLDLIPEAQQVLDRGLITAGHAILLARLKPEDQKRMIHPHLSALFEDEHERLEPTGAGHRWARASAQRKERKTDRYAGLKARSVRELETWIAEHIRFDLQHMADAAPLEFGGTADAAAKAQAKPGRGKKVVPITFEYVAPSGVRDPKERTYGSSAWKLADAREGGTACEYSVLGVVAGGPRYGRAFEVCIARDKCEVHWKKETVERERRRKQLANKGGGGAKRPSWQEQAKARQEQSKKEQAERARRETEWRKAVPMILAAVAAKVRSALSIARVGQEVLRRLDGADVTRARALLKLKGAGGAEEVLRVALLADLLDDADHLYRRDAFLRRAKVVCGVDWLAIARQVQTSAATTEKKSAASTAATKPRAVARAKKPVAAAAARKPAKKKAA